MPIFPPLLLMLLWLVIIAMVVGFAWRTGEDER